MINSDKSFWVINTYLNNFPNDNYIIPTPKSCDYRKNQIKHDAAFVSKEKQSFVYEQWKRIEYDSTFDDFNELIIQFGFVSM